MASGVEYLNNFRCPSQLQDKVAGARGENEELEKVDQLEILHPQQFCSSQQPHLAFLGHVCSMKECGPASPEQTLLVTGVNSVKGIYRKQSHY